VGEFIPLSAALGGLSHQFWRRHNHVVPINISIEPQSDDLFERLIRFFFVSPPGFGNSTLLALADVS
jgi:hypothetical protein